MTETQESGSTERRYGGTPSGPGDFFRAEGASARSSLKLGGGTSCIVGVRGMCVAADMHQGELRWRMGCIFRVGTGSVEGDGGLSSVYLIRRRNILERGFAWRANCFTSWPQSEMSTCWLEERGREALTCPMAESIQSVILRYQYSTS